MKQFSIVEDNELISQGSHFFCKACLVAVPVDQRSSNPDYCRQCWASLEVDRIAAVDRSRGKWTGAAYSTGKEKFTIKPTGIAAEVTEEKPPSPVLTGVSSSKPSSLTPETLRDKEMPTPTELCNKDSAAKHPGRPRKDGEVCRSTTLRREKRDRELQGVLTI